MIISALKHNQENFQNNRNIPKEVNKCYQFSTYLLDLKSHLFKAVVRILAFGRKFINNVRKHSSASYDPYKTEKNIKKTITLSDEEIAAFQVYFF